MHGRLHDFLGSACSMHATMWVYQRPMDETIDGDGKEKAVTTFLGRHHVSRRLYHGYIYIHFVRLHTAYAYP